MMVPAAIQKRDWRVLLVLLAAFGVSGAAHVALAIGVSRIEPPEREEMQWVVVEVNTPPPPPEVEPEPQPEPEPEPEPEPQPRPEPEPLPDPVPQPDPPPVPEEVDFEETTPDPPSEAPPPDRRPVRRLTQGLSNNSMSDNGIDMGARTGNTTATSASAPQLDPDEDVEFATVAYASVTAAPRIRNPPTLVIPDVVREQEIEGRVEAELTIGADGSVQAVTLMNSLHPEADQACRAALLSSRWRPGSRDGTPVIVRGVPYSCRFAMTDY